MPVSAVTSATLSPAAVANASQTGTARAPKKELGQEDFLQLLATQLQQQDPLKPMDDLSFIGQMAQFSSLQQMSQLSADQQQLTAAGYLGRYVTIKDSTGKIVTGQVSAVDYSGSSPALDINGVNYPLSLVQRVAPAPAATPTSS